MSRLSSRLIPTGFAVLALVPALYFAAHFSDVLTAQHNRPGSWVLSASLNRMFFDFAKLPYAWARDVHGLLAIGSIVSTAVMVGFLTWRLGRDRAAVEAANALAGFALGYGLFGIVHPLRLLPPDYAWAYRWVDGAGAIALAWGLTSAIRFAMHFPRVLDIDAVEQWQRTAEQTRMAKSRQRLPRLRIDSKLDAWESRSAVRRAIWRLLASPWLFPVLAAVLGTTALIIDPRWPITMVMLPVSLLLVVLLSLVGLYTPFWWLFTTGAGEDRRKIFWLYWGLTVWVYLVGFAEGAPMLWMGLFDGGEAAVAFMTTYVGFGIAAALLLGAISLTMAIAFSGAFDPRLAITKTSVIGLLGLLLAAAMLGAERFAERVLVSSLHLPSHSSLWISVGVALVIFKPVSRRLEQKVDGGIERVMPASSLAGARREIVTAVFVDLCGYTELSITDEPTALTLASLLHKESQRLGERTGGRVVKTIGDAVLLAFPESRAAAAWCLELQEKFAAAAAGLQLPALPLHFGLHAGEIVCDKRGDIFGGTVNMAARLQGQAAAGEIIASAEVAAQLGADAGIRVESIGERVLKGVPGTVACFRLT